MTRAAVLAVLALAACATTPPEVQVSHETVKANVAVPTPCVREADIPKKPATVMRKDGDIAQLAAGAKLEVRHLDAYADKLDAMLRACAK